jgi:hypothetical protein
MKSRGETAVRATLTVAVLLILADSAGGAGWRDTKSPTFARAKSYATGKEPAAVAVGDLTGDGRPDLVSANGSPSKSVSVLINKGDGRFRAKREFGTGGKPVSVAIGDLDGDGSGDIATANHAGTVSILLNKGDGSFRGKRAYVAGSNPESVAIGDVNGDGKPDVVTANDGEAGVSVLLNAGDGSFQARRDFGRGLQGSKLAIGDLNGDGSTDLVASGITLGGFPKQVIAVFLNARDGSFPTRRDYEQPFAPTSIDVGDVNGDGKPDLVWASCDEETGAGVVVQLNRGRGGFGQGKGYGVHGDCATAGTSVAIGDFNGDRKPDLALTSRLRAVSVLVNKGAGAFRRQLDYGTGYPLVVLADDLNGDRRQDLVVSVSEPAYGANVLLNRPGLCNVQDLRRQTLIIARQTLARVNCRVGKIGFAYSRTIRGRVIGQKPKLGAVLPGGSRVDVVFSRGGRP